MARPRSFSQEAAIAAIKGLFWRVGYDGASMQAIEAATGLNKQSLYRLYGDKRGMYLAALVHYRETEVAAAVALLSGPGGPRERMARLMQSAVDEAVAGDRRGCFLCNASIDRAPLDQEVAAEISRAIVSLRVALTDPSGGFAGRDTQASEALAGALLSGYLGLRVMIRAGISERDLRVAADAMLGSL